MSIFMSGTFFLQHMFGMQGSRFHGRYAIRAHRLLFIAYFSSTERLSPQLRKRSSIHGLHRSISSQTATVGDPPPTMWDTRHAHDEETPSVRYIARSGSTTGSSNLDSLQRGTTATSSAVAQRPRIHLQGCRGVGIKDRLSRVDE
jgi:hypothetical protein